MRNLSIKLYRIYVCYTNITLCDVIFSIRYYPRFHVTAVGLGTYYVRMGGGPPVYTIYNSILISFPTHVLIFSEPSS
jgi:hypothetical protein